MRLVSLQFDVYTIKTSTVYSIGMSQPVKNAVNCNTRNNKRKAKLLAEYPPHKIIPRGIPSNTLPQCSETTLTRRGQQINVTNKLMETLIAPNNRLKRYIWHVTYPDTGKMRMQVCKCALNHY